MASPITSSSMLDVQGMVSALMRAESRPIVQMQGEVKKIDVKISAYGKLQSQLSAFRDAAAALSRFDSWRTVKASSSNASAVDMTASSGAAATQHAVEVQKLAASQTVTSGAFASSDAIVGSGTLRIQMGTQPGGAASFTPDASRAEVAVTIPANATLAQVRDAINASSSGARASIVRDGDQVRLFVSSTTSGGNQAFRIQATDDDGNSTDTSGLSALAFDPVAASGSGQNLTLMKGAADAQYTIDGVALTARGNTITDAMDGINLTLKQVTTAPVQLEISSDSDAMQASMQKFIDAYNSLNTLLAEQTKFDESSKTAGPLQGDSSAVGILSQVRSIVRETVTGGTLSRLGDVGVSLQRDGSLKFNTAAFKSAASDPTRLEALMSAAGTGGSDKGLMVRFRELGDRLLGSDGAVTNATSTWQARRTSLQRREDAFQVRLDAMEKRLLAQYSALDAKLSAAQQNSAQLQSALAGLPKIG